ncbi:MAG: ATP-binding protein [Micropepsaceae bacterium]
MIVQSRVALGLAALALLGGFAAIYVPASRVSSDIDRALQQEDDVLADALKERLLADAEEDVRAIAILADAQGLGGLAAVGESMRSAVRVNAIIVTDAAGRPLQTYAAIDTPGGVARTPAVKAMAKQVASGNGEVLRGFLRAYGQTYATAAARVTNPDDEGDPITVIVFTRIERAVMARLSEDYGLANLDLAQEEPDGETSSLPLADPHGHITGYLTWQVSGPAQKMLEQLGPWIGGVVIAVAVVLALLAIVTLRAYRRAANAALANQVLEKADRAKSLLFANLSHEFRTPLNAVIGFSDLMKSRTFGPLGHPKYDEYVGDIHNSASHLLGLIEDVLILSRYEASEGVTLNDAVLLEDTIDDTIRMLKQQAARKGLRLHANPTGGLRVLCTDKALRQIVINLVGNAIKYTEQGHIRVTATPSATGAEVDLVVSDTGIGIAPEHLGRITRPFEQVDDVYARKQGGTGLGLSIVTTIIAHAGGRLSIESEVGHGTRVTATFRRAPDAAGARRAA